MQNRKERFSFQRKSKLDTKGDGLFQVIAKINDNAHKLDLSGKYNVSTTFTIVDLSPYEVSDEDSRTNLESENDWLQMWRVQVNY